jgi:hypothetical protein
LFRKALATAVSFVLAAVSSYAFAAEILPTRVGTCAQSHITNIGQRLVDGANKPIEGSGSIVAFSNGLHQVSYDDEPEIIDSHIGDPVLICLIALPKNCPPGDNRGKVYTTTNLRRQKSWTLMDSQHICGGA